MIETGISEFALTINGQSITGLVNSVPAPETVNDFSLDAAIYGIRNSGKTRYCYTLFGVEYSRQPVGQYRWKPPQVKPPMTAIDARRFGPVPPQGYSQEGIDYGYGRSDLGWKRGLSSWGALGTRESEGCLNSNWYLPDIDTSVKKPCVVEFHPGGSNYLSANDDRKAGYRVCLEGIIYVRVNTRLGNLGHYYLPGMEDEPDYQGVNHGVNDAICFLDFLQAYGSDLGVDVNRITVTGGSAGGNLALVLLANASARTRFHRVTVSSPSAGINTRYEAEPKKNTRGYKQFFADRKKAYIAMFRILRSQIENEKTLAQVKADLIAGGATENEAFAKVMREHLYLQDFLGFDEGAVGQQLSFNGYDQTRSLTIMNDGVTCFHESNLAAALAGAFPGTHELIITVAEDEASVIGGGSAANLNFAQEVQDLCRDTTQRWSRSAVYDTEWDGSPATPSWGSLSIYENYYPWGVAIEPNRMIFNHGYQYPAYCIARAITQAGGTAYLELCNWRPVAGYGYRVGHTADEPVWLANMQWPHFPPGEFSTEPLSVIDIRMGDTKSKMFANFARTGNPNTASIAATSFDLFETPDPAALTAFNPATKNWNVWGLPYRSASTVPPTITNTPGFWGHAWDYYDSRWGV
jgi:carboxylesterase type B